MSTPLPKGNRGGDGDRDACRRPCHLFSRALLLSLKYSLKFMLMLSCSLMFPSSLSSSIHPSSGLIYFVPPPLLLMYLHLCHLSLPLLVFSVVSFVTTKLLRYIWKQGLSEPVKHCDIISFLSKCVSFLTPLQTCSLWSSSP